VVFTQGAGEEEGIVPTGKGDRGIAAPCELAGAAFTGKGNILYL